MKRHNQAKYAATRLAIQLGPGNLLVQTMLRAVCRRQGVALRFRGQTLDLIRGRRVMRIASQRFGYAPALAATFDTYFNLVEPRELGRSLLVDYSRPAIQRYLDSGLEFEIASFPEEAATIDDYFRWYRPRDGDLAFDVGAYCGVSTYSLSRSVGESGRVIAFEPDPVSYGLLARNIARHRLRNVTALQVAIGPTTGRLPFFAEGTLGSVLAAHSPRVTMGTRTTVDALSFRDACERFGVPAFVKMDIDGSEIAVLDASRDLLRAQPLNLALDTHHWIDGRRTTAAVEAILADCGYDVLSSDESGFWTTWARPTHRSFPRALLIPG
jgi:FkbM family methyltransferase